MTHSLTRSEEGTALFEGVMTLLLFLPIWMFIVYIGSAGTGVADAYQRARNDLWQKDVDGDCVGGAAGGSLGPSASVPGISDVGGTYYSLQYDPPRPATVNSYAAALGFPTTLTRNAVAGCARFPAYRTEDGPNFPDAVYRF